MFDLNDKVVIVTGASQGIGRTMATVFAESGAMPAVCDISDGDSFSRTIKSVVDQFGKLDVLVNNAGITRDALLMRMNESQWDEVIQTNLKSVYKLSQTVLRPMMKKN